MAGALIIVLIIWKQVSIRNYLKWEDEFETIIASRMIASGGNLYQDVFNQHGPATFFIGFFLEKLSLSSIEYYRNIIILVQLISILSITLSPILISKLTRIFVLIGVSAYLLTITPQYFSHTYTYQNLAGMALLIIFSQLVVPTVVMGQKPNKFILIICLVLITYLPFLAITYLPLSLTLVFLLWLKKLLKVNYLFYVFVFSLLPNLIFLFRNASWRGFFVQHIYINSTIMPDYYPYQSIKDLPMNLLRSLDPNQFWILPLILVVLILVIRDKKISTIQLIILILGTASLLIRGVDFQALPFYYLIPSLALIVVYRLDKLKNSKIIFSSLSFLAIVILLISLGDKKIQESQIPKVTEFSQLADFFTKKNDRVFSYTFENSEYVISNRLPASAYFYYLPMQAEYDKKPILGVTNSICSDLERVRPKIGYLEIYDFAPSTPWNAYANCVNEIIYRDYFQLPFNTLFIRKDILRNYNDDLYVKFYGKTSVTEKARENVELEILLDKDFFVKDLKINGIGILFATYGTELDRKTKIRLRSYVSNSNIDLNLDPTKVIDNRYTFIDLTPDDYTNFSILADRDLDLSIWNSETDSRTQPCLILRFEDETFQLTPGCQPF
jgi:hypothetical protein